MPATPEAHPEAQPEAHPEAAQQDLSTRLVLCGTQDVAEGESIEVEIDDYYLAVFNVRGSFHVTDNACTHGPGLLSEGYLEGRVVECDFHGGRFDVITGRVLAPPCMVPIRTYRTIVEDGKVSIEVE
jgi:nitrite reductase/ring-hydroxylating ferredoxin subunit